MDPAVYKRLKELEEKVARLEAKDQATYDTLYVGSTPVDHFNRPTLNAAWSWAGAPLGGTPDTRDLATFPSHLAVYDTAQPMLTKFFLQRTSPGVDPYLRARFLPMTSTQGGLRMDNGTDNSYAEILFENSGTAGLMQLIARTRFGGGGVGATLLAGALPIHPITLTITKQGTNVLTYYSLEPHFLSHPGRFVGTIALGGAWNASRVGIIHAQQDAFANSDRQTIIDWYQQQ